MVDTVLLIDDEQDFLDSLAARLEQRGLKVATATSPEEALGKYQLEAFDAIVLDMMMPTMDGLEALNRFREQDENLQVIVLTGFATVAKGVEAMKLGAMDFLEKPVDIQTLVKKIHEAKKHRILLLERRMEKEVQDILGRHPW